MQEFTILVVDDDPAILNMLDELLTSNENYRVVLAGDSQEAVTLFYAEPRIDVVLTDIHMPDHTGLEMVADMKTVDFEPEILVMTANGNPENVEKARKIGARAMILKPFDNLDVIEAEIRKAIEASAEKRGEELQDDVTASRPAAAPTEEPTEKLSEKPTEEPTVKLTKKLTKELPDEPTEDLTARLTRELTEELAEVPTHELVKEATAKPTKEATEELAEVPTCELVEEPTAKLTKEATEDLAEVPTCELVEEPTAKLSNEPTEELTEESTEELREPAEDEVIPSVPAPAIDLPERPTVGGISASQLTRTLTGNRHHVPQETTDPKKDIAATAEDAKTTPEETAPEIPAELESIFHVPIVCLQTLEEQDAIDALRRLARKLRRKLNTWSATRGIVDGAGKVFAQADVKPIRAGGFRQLVSKLYPWSSTRKTVDGAGKILAQAHLDPISALKFIGRQTRDDIFILADFGRYLEDPKIVRTLREMVLEGHTARAMVVLTAPRMIIHPELESSCEVFDWPESKEQDIEAVFDQVCKAMEAAVGRPISLDADARETLFERLKGMPADRVRFEIAGALTKTPS